MGLLTKLCTFTLFFAILLPATVSAKEIAIVVNPSNPTDELSYRSLVRIFKREQLHWDHGGRVYLIIRESGSAEKAVALSAIYKLKGDHELKKFWLTKIFREEIAFFPQVLNSDESVKQFVSKISRAIGFISGSHVDKRVKVLRIEGKLPGQTGYLLTDNP